MVPAVPIKTKMTADGIRDCLTSHVGCDKSDLGLGKSTKPGCRNQVRPGDENLAFGLTTNKLNAMGARMMEFGGASDAIAPNPLSNCISQEDMLKQRTKNGMVDVLESVGCRFRPAMFQGIWQRAAKNECGGVDEYPFKATVSVSSFVQAMKELKAVPTA